MALTVWLLREVLVFPDGQDSRMESVLKQQPASWIGCIAGVMSTSINQRQCFLIASQLVSIRFVEYPLVRLASHSPCEALWFVSLSWLIGMMLISLANAGLLKKRVVTALRWLIPRSG